jgi:hypothetical protein
MKQITFLLIGIIVAILGLTALRLATIQDTSTHFHSNFAMYLNGEEVNFAQDKYMEEVSACSLSKEVLPKQRAHMHNKVGNLVHVHDHGVTWGHFFLNIGWNLGKDYISDDTGTMYKNTDTSSVKYLLNGESVSNISNVLIKSEDSLLVSFGSETDDVSKERFEKIEHSAHEANTAHDPSTCSGAEKPTFLTKLKRSFIN